MLIALSMMLLVQGLLELKLGNCDHLQTLDDSMKLEVTSVLARNPLCKKKVFQREHLKHHFLGKSQTWTFVSQI